MPRITYHHRPLLATLLIATSLVGCVDPDSDMFAEDERADLEDTEADEPDDALDDIESERLENAHEPVDDGEPTTQSAPPSELAGSAPALVASAKKSAAPTLGDYNNDGLADLLCHDTSGTLWIDLAYQGEFNGTNWMRSDANWCHGASQRLYKGDFNGDGRTDLLCHDIENGHKWIDYSSGSMFTGTNWATNNGWCYLDSQELHIGDFNGDGRDDLLCHDVDSGYKWIDYANASGQFLGTNWSRDANWCHGEEQMLLVGDFNGDGRTDLFCNGGNAERWIDYANPNGQFLGTDWSRSGGGCGKYFTPYIGDFGGNGKDDLLCYNPDELLWFTYGGTSTYPYAKTNNCDYPGGELLIGDVDGDNADDIVCGYPASSTTTVYLAAQDFFELHDIMTWCYADEQTLF